MITLPPKNFETLTYIRDSWVDVRIAVIGATGLAIHGHPPPRRSDDIDLAIAVEPEALRELRSTLQPTGWEQVRRLPHRWRHFHHGLSVDIIPVGREPGAVSEYTLAPGLTLDVRGLDVALRTTVDREVACQGETGKTVIAPTPPLAVLMLLKMIAYVDKPSIREKDAADVGRVMLGYLDEDDERRWSPPLASVHEADFQGACELGREMQTYLTDEYRSLVETFIDDRRVRGRFDSMSSVEDAGNEIARAFYRGLEFVQE
jgi:predicted nucleotidyltransferase